MAIRFGMVDSISGSVLYRHRGKVDLWEAYKTALNNHNVPFQFVPGNDKVYIVTPDDTFSALGRIQALREAARQVRELAGAGTPFASQLNRRLDAEQSAILNQAVPLDFWA
ncbi:MAG TPA: hypothetical protein V6C52_02225 [Coleofasciculaceae cyanobacterium]|jgi:hypothetical protein